VYGNGLYDGGERTAGRSPSEPVAESVV
jgi:hypothetical protein